jgi:DNA mismatch repair protein MutL
MVAQGEVPSVLEQLLADCREHDGRKGFSQTDVFSKTLSRSLAVKAGEVLDAASRQALVDDLFACKEPALSPFNKLVYTTITENDIDKKFT